MSLDEGSIFMQGQTTIELPPHFIVLPLAVIRETTDKLNIIIACGRQTPEGDLDIMTGTGKLMSISSEKWPLPVGKGVPIDGGKAIAFPEAAPVRLIDSESIIRCANTLVNS